MSTFFMFGNYCDESLQTMSTDRTEKSVQLLQDMGGKVVAMYALLGEHDLVIIVDLPDIEQAIRASVALAKMSGIAFSTAPAITVAEFDKLLEAV